MLDWPHSLQRSPRLTLEYKKIILGDHKNSTILDDSNVGAHKEKEAGIKIDLHEQDESPSQPLSTQLGLLLLPFYGHSTLPFALKNSII
ncbi:hypothetical protein DSUL_80072 [Desulfovibrionales bacterium]